MQNDCNRLLRFMRKPPDIASSDNQGSRAPILSMIADRPSCFPSIPRLNLVRDAEITDDMFQIMLRRAGREFAKLLQDVSDCTSKSSVISARNEPLSKLLVRAVRCAANQYILQAELGNLALTDCLTGTYNRRGFQLLAERQMKLARRSRSGMMLFFIDVDGLKRINDSFGHAKGDQVLKHTVETLKKSFRDSDVLGRLGGDEFAVLAIAASGRSESTIKERLQKYLSILNADDPQCEISLSVGVARFDHGKHSSISDLMAMADRAMYEAKRDKTRTAITCGSYDRDQ